MKNLKIFAVTLCLLGSLMLYGSHRHQSLFGTVLSKKNVILGGGLLMISMILLLCSVPKLVAIYMWCMTLITTWSLLPFIALFKKNI
ncbi:hypothetical protein [Acinetobacter sp. ASP199]|uniref:hypothetical protein n=1 Tax=unclassified Acinetobacter TaxID=196816 RepID=UPI001F60B768|nr:hypothetical protein [Acinetobacter sp. ASP199]UNT58105.1 hypothetical protein IHE35_08105 [Acinetobacter sp. ASP199]